MPNYAIYLRKSRADYEAEQRGEGETLARHRTTLEALAARNKHHIAQVYAEVVSGETISGRPEVQRLLADVLKGKYEGVYCMEVERLARGDVSDQGRIAETFLFSKTKIITPMKVYDPTDAFDVEYFEFSLFMSRREYKTINRRIQAGRLASVREGKYICSRPAYGYKRVKIQGDKGYTLEPIPSEAEVVRWIFNTYLRTDMGITRIANALADKHTPVGEQGSGWASCRVYRILTNEVYIGKIRWGKVKYEKELQDGVITKRLVTQDNYELYDGLHPAIIDPEVFADVARKLREPRTIPKNDGHKSNPLSGLLVCSECGRFMRGLPSCGRQPAQVFCHTRGCPTVRTYRGPVEVSVLNTLTEWLAKANVDSSDDIIRPKLDALDALERDKAKLTAQIERLQDLLEQDVYTVKQYSERYSTLSRRMADIDAAIAKEREDARTEYMTPKQLAPAIRHVLATYHTSTPAEQNALLKTCISKIVYKKSIRGNSRGTDIRKSSDLFILEVFPLALRR